MSLNKDIITKRLESFIKNAFVLNIIVFPSLEIYAYDVCNELILNDRDGIRPTSK